MAKIYNSNVTKKLAENAAIQQNTDKVPVELAEKIVPTFETNQAALKQYPIRTITLNGNATGIAYSGYLPAKRIFVVGISVGFSKNAACDAATGTIDLQGNPIGMSNSTQLIRIPIITLQAQDFHTYMPFAIPLEVEPGSRFGMTGTYAAGVMQRNATIHYYELDNFNA